MSYSIWLSSKSKFRIPADKVDACLDGILSTKNKWLADAVKSAAKHIKYFEHIPSPLKFIELVNQIWGFKFTPNKDNNDLDKIDYERENMHDLDGFCNVVASYVESGSYLEFKGEDAEVWRYVFRDGTWKNVKPVVTWPE